jgi:hypothetical protein
VRPIAGQENVPDSIHGDCFLDTTVFGVLSCDGVPIWSDQRSGRRLRVLLSRVQLRLTFGKYSNSFS